MAVLGCGLRGRPQIPAWKAGALLTAAVFGQGAHAADQTLYMQHGILLRVSIRVAAYEAGRCRVSAPGHPEEARESLADNEGQPLHVWKVVVSVANHSPGELSSLRAQVRVESRWPPCDSWDLETGPYSDVRWDDQLMEVHEPDGLARDGLVSNTRFLVVAHDETPTVGVWNVRYRFPGDGLEPFRRGGTSSRSVLPARERIERPAADLPEMEFVWIPPGEFSMGSISARSWEPAQPLTRVRISQGFWLGRFEVTQDEWQAVMGSNPSRFSKCGRCPVEQVSWEDVQEFIGRLNREAGAHRYRLPTEAEWEYAARAGTTGDRYGEVGAIAWYRGNSGSRTHPVGEKAPNSWGLHDMLGNVCEWVEDWFDDHYPGGAVTDPSGPATDYARGYRGAGFRDHTDRVTAWKRDRRPPSFRLSDVGFRLLRME